VPGAQPCREADAPQPVVDPNVITFGLDTIFEPKRTDIQSLSPAGKRELALIVQKINVKYKSFKDVKVHVVGYADDEIDENGNLQISHERAKTVRAYFKAQGIRATALTFEGRGSLDKRKAEILGLSPRRVEVEVAVEIR
jgi:outer membrane protein OmpA-like peptidoglycan-associated protein